MGIRFVRTLFVSGASRAASHERHPPLMADLDGVSRAYVPGPYNKALQTDHQQLG